MQATFAIMTMPNEPLKIGICKDTGNTPENFVWNSEHGEACDTV
jgi:hypothetical protein